MKYVFLSISTLCCLITTCDILKEAAKELKSQQITSSDFTASLTGYAITSIFVAITVWQFSGE